MTGRVRAHRRQSGWSDRCVGDRQSGLQGRGRAAAGAAGSPPGRNGPRVCMRLPAP